MSVPARLPKDGSDQPELVIDVDNVTKAYLSGEVEALALRGVSLQVRRGEMVAIVGASGSGKSTLMHILGCLDRPSSGSYRLLGHDVSDLGPVERSRVRGLVLGFVFQGFHLLPGTSALDNVELPLVYRGTKRSERRHKAHEALARVGLAHREGHTPAQLSGGQQQRVAIARALVSHPEVLLADEPTGNLDSATTDDVLGLLQELHEREQLTVLLVTHEPEVARAATRIVTMKDGRIVSDVPVKDRRIVREAQAAPVDAVRALRRTATVISPSALVGMGLRLALQSLRRSVLRTALTTLGILIGVAAVVTTSGIGAGAKLRMEKEMMALGANVLMVNHNWNMASGARGAQGTGSGITRADADAVGKEIPSVAAAAPVQSTNSQVVAGARNVSTKITGTTPAFLTIRAWVIESGRGFTDEDLSTSASVCLIGKTVEKNLFPAGDNPLGTTIRVNRMPCVVEGVLGPKGQSGWGQDQDDVILMPLTTFRAHVNKRAGDDIDNIVVSARDASAVFRAQAQITSLMRQRHAIRAGAEDDFMVRNLTEMMNALDAQRAAITMLLLVMASVSLIVGGIGVMNIMLVSVTERTREIGIRLAIGARPIDILTQFLLEAIVLASMGGLAGLLLGIGAGRLVGKLTDYQVSLQPESALMALLISCGIGIVFGFFPARSAAKLDPIQALRHE